ncbi:hypothetical protein SPRG_05179 [Saprolegnia parasitica CBS 223.65]|uniref:Rhodanese domain-containing protein n=1 Tax=Saprolegnia parasitica (strain CBS 223.65) TaxID=695850 RepID=A0A067CL97_SAPPC|nr:hypothetical protein SPRG_05179 [Saprolegnia parasitica CBS 223.65]KDO29990.1 hypothetical protein SPRG_05179 [Saprolegnia parasitica CBS 223.65]|eukprot:XP_012199173.1 hypothetical protein SPRG_05179 [Saprolegnia parasitica CBS 223.65]
MVTDGFETELDAAANRRYSRQLLVSDFGVQRQKTLLEARVLVVGAGGLGCPVLLYLGGMGVGHIGVVDGDVVDETNLHRQVLHTQAAVGRLKVESARDELQRRHPHLSLAIHPFFLTPANAAELVRAYDVVVDASDNVATRYLVSDVCVLEGKPLVSGSALGLEGQVAVYHYKDGPCYRCCYPNAMPMGLTGNCSDNGVLGVVPGIIGSMQAMEVVKVLTGMGTPLSRSQAFYDAYDGSVRHFKLSPRRKDCAVCGEAPTILSALDSAATSSAGHCTLTSSLSPDHVMSVEDLAVALRRASSPDDYCLLDVREPVQFAICHLRHAVNIPLKALPAQLKRVPASKPVYVICRRGVDSVDAALLLLQSTTRVWHIEGGLDAWAARVDPAFPMY